MRLVRGVLCALAFLPAAKGMEVKVLSPIPRPEPKAVEVPPAHFVNIRQTGGRKSFQRGFR